MPKPPSPHTVTAGRWGYTSLAASAATLFGDDWPPYGLELNLQMLTDFCRDQYAQKLLNAPVDPMAAFATRFAR